MTRRRKFAPRDQHASAFSAVLLRLCDAVGATGGALVDAEGETVDYAGAIDPFDIKIAAAEFCVLLALIRNASVLGWDEAEEVLVRGAKRSYSAHLLGEGYAVVLQLLPHAFAVSRRAMAEALRELCKESGLPAPRWVDSERERWLRVDVRCASPKKPDAVWVDGAWCSLEVLGTYRDNVAARSRETGYRARLETGAEITLVREPLGRWYADMLPSRR